MERLEFIFYILITLVIGVVIGAVISVGSTPKPSMIIMTKTEEDEEGGGISGTDVKNLGNLAKVLNPFNE